jgi:hypothetical protein
MDIRGKIALVTGANRGLGRRGYGISPLLQPVFGFEQRASC